MRALSQMTSAPAKLRNSFAWTIVAAPGPSGVRAMHACDARATACRAFVSHSGRELPLPLLLLLVSLALPAERSHLDRASDLPTATRYMRIPNTPSRDSARDDDDVVPDGLSVSHRAANGY